jgi:hypothetical protein
VQLGEMQRAVGVCDVAEDAAGPDRGELLITTNLAAPWSVFSCRRHKALSRPQF